jgi:hypothetical protein
MSEMMVQRSLEEFEKAEREAAMRRAPSGDKGKAPAEGSSARGGKKGKGKKKGRPLKSRGASVSKKKLVYRKERKPKERFPRPWGNFSDGSTRFQSKKKKESSEGDLIVVIVRSQTFRDRLR